MSGSPGFVFDTNVMVSALLLQQSVPARAFRHAIRHGRILLSPPVAEELHGVLNRAKFDRYLLREERKRLIAALLRESALVHVV